MALTYDDLTSKTNKFIVPRMVDEVYKSSPLFTRLRSKNMERFEGGTSIRHPIMYAKLKGGPFTRGGSFDTSYVQTDTAQRTRASLRVIVTVASGEFGEHLQVETIPSEVTEGIGSVKRVTARRVSPNNNPFQERPTNRCKLAA
jgi:hypothetical protein